ncbi:MAG: hypothetical protein Q7S40_16165 [Opitutaceae bacterium]|nr:hypothetical protein [Opitutaceae bacterium]
MIEMERVHSSGTQRPIGQPRGGGSAIHRWLERGLVAAALAITVWFYTWTVAVNNGFEDWGDTDYYRLLVRGWKKGQLHLDKDPRPELLALADPYDPFQNAEHKLGDATLYRGRYYIYFGAAPALTLMLPYALVTGREMTMGAATLVFSTVAFLTASGLWLALRRRYFPGSMIAMAPLGVLAIGFGTHLLTLAQRPMFWELAIAGGIAFSMLAVAAAYCAIHGRRPLAAMAAAGLCLGLAVGSRPTCLVAAPLLLAPLWLAWRQRPLNSPGIPGAVDMASTPRCRSWGRMAIAAALPLAACGAAIMAHNHVRFNHPFEFGQHYQLSGAHEGKLTHFSVRFLPHNFAVYFFQALGWQPEFPFANAQAIEVDDIPGYFGTEEVSGLAATFPFYWFLLALPLAWWRRERDEAWRLSAVFAAVAGYALPVMAVVLCYFSTTMRYEADFAVALAVLALGGMLSLERWATGARSAAGERTPLTPVRPGRWFVAAGAGVAGVVTVLVGVLVSFDYHGRPLAISAALTWQKLADAPYLAAGEVGRWLGRIEGPRVLKIRLKQRPPGTTEIFWESSDPRAQERIALEHLDERLIRFGYARGLTPTQWGRPLRWERDHTHTVSVQLPSLYPKISHGGWNRLRQRDEFRERTAVVVWFSGGRALEAVVDPLPDGITPGGTVGRTFSGEVRKAYKRLYRPDEIEWGLADYYAPRGGVLQLRVIFPSELRAEGEPLFVCGEGRYHSNILFVEPAEGGLRFVFEDYGRPRVNSGVVRPNPGGHRIEFELPSFRPEAYGWEETGDIVVRVDGQEVLRSTQVGRPFPWGAEQIGRNVFGTTCGAYFRGWIFDAKWVRER